MGETRDGNAVEATAGDIFSHANVQDEHELLALRSLVSPDGNEAELTLHTTKGSIKLIVLHEQLAAVHAEIEALSALMVYRQSARPDEGMTAFADSFRTALSPADCTVSIDPETSDRLFMLQFPDRLPLAIRMAPEQVADSLDQLESVSRRAAN
ncbi:hypothetical protein NKH17_12610 [Mesorhizobium sp. M1334]|uniref:hypothetical protein n=1 Tax=Mesorhizobium sp. M1334 TaxID=2957084 RepID=UPI00333B0D85